MGTYVIGGAVLFAIGFITYEIYEGFKTANNELSDIASKASDPVIIANTASTAESLATPLGAISAASGGLGGYLGEQAAEWFLS